MKRGTIPPAGVPRLKYLLQNLMIPPMKYVKYLIKMIIPL
jgi:hypothetical protein